MNPFKNHPKALPYLFLTEMWERFGFYVVQGMLVLYMSKGFGFSDDHSYIITGVFSALAYIAPFIGGSLADRLLGFKTSIILGGLFLSAGYAMLALPWVDGFYFALATIIVGSGLFKPNISSLLGSLYGEHDLHRESGFTIFYVGINTGILLAGLSSGYIKDHFGWHAGFGLASIGLIIGLATFLSGLKKLTNIKHNSAIVLSKINWPQKIIVIFCCLLVILLIGFLLQSPLLAKCLLPVAGVLLLAFLFIITYQQTLKYRRRLLNLNALILSSIVFWMLYMQMFFSANFFIDRLVKRDWLGFHIPTTAFYAFEAIFVILSGPAFAWSWQTLNQARKNPSSFSKFVLAIIFAGLGMLTLGVSTYFPNADMLINPLWVILAYFLITVGEMLLSPIGLSAVTTLSPRQLVGMMMGIWFVALGFGAGFAGWLAKLANVPVSVTDLGAQLIIYRHAFLDYTLIAFALALFLYAIPLFYKRFYRSESS